MRYLIIVIMIYIPFQPPSYNVPVGDPRKVIERETTMNASFQDVSNQNQRQHYSIEDVSRVLNQTNFKQQDGHYKWNDYRSTALASYVPASVAGICYTQAPITICVMLLYR